MEDFNVPEKNLTTTWSVTKKHQKKPIDSNILIDLALNFLSDAVEIEKLYDKLKFQQNKTSEQQKFKKNKETIIAYDLTAKYYYCRSNDNNAPRICICVIYDKKTKQYHRGLSICSFQDIVNKEYGRDTAEDRALHAFLTKKSSQQVKRYEVISIISLLDDNSLDILRKTYNNFDTTCTIMDCCCNNNANKIFKCDYNVTLNDFEKKIFSNKKEIKK